MEAVLATQGRTPGEVDNAELESLWLLAKRELG
jgi:hypothetical protein